MRKQKSSRSLAIQQLEDRLTLTANAVAVTGAMIASQPVFAAGEIVGSAAAQINVISGASQGGSATNDAPAATGVAGLSSSDSQNYAVELHDAFSDPDGSVTDLVFAIDGTPDPAIFQSVSIDTATGTMSVVLQSGASGQAALSIIAMDAHGASATADVDFDTDSSSEVSFVGVVATPNSDGTWTVTGTFHDSTPDDGESDAAEIQFGGGMSGTAIVADDGSFSHTGTVSDLNQGFSTTAFDSGGNQISETIDYDFDED